MHMKLKTLLTGTAMLTVFAAAIPASAQTPATTPDQPSVAANGLEEIVVTARRREEKAQTVPAYYT